MSDDVHKARKLLRTIERFDGKEATPQQVESVWRRRFELTVRAYSGVTDSDKLQLWKECVADASTAADWMDQMELDSKIRTWAELTKELDERWPAPDPTAKKRKRMEAWYKHEFDKTKLGEMVLGSGGEMEPYYVHWAKEHAAIGADTGVNEETKVNHTWYLLPVPLKGLLNKSVTDYQTLTSLCRDIRDIDHDRVAHLASTDDKLTTLLKRLSIVESKTQQMVSNRAPSQPRQPQAPVTGPQVAPTTTPTVAPTTNRSSARARGSAHARGYAYYDTPTGRADYRAAIAARPPSTGATTWSYPLTPGTQRQTAKLCPRCGKGEHDRAACQGTPLNEKEIEWRTSAREALLAGTSSSERKPLYQILVENGYDEGEAEKLQNMLDSGNVSGQ